MKYYIDFQYHAKGETRPRDDGRICPIEAPDAALVPNVGDYVEVALAEPHRQFMGRVTSRLFRYMYEDLPGQGQACMVNVVVTEDSAADWGKLIKE